MKASTSADPGRIFISYRREETAPWAGWLFDRLAGYYGKGQVFKDVDSIQPGDDFVEVIARAVGACDVLLALIGDQWLTVTDEAGHRRLDDPDDFVRLEIEAALKRDVRVVPILVEGARMPRESELPASLAKLVRRQALDLSPSHFETDTAKLLKVVNSTITDLKAQPAVRRDGSGDPTKDAQERARQDAERAMAHRRQQEIARQQEAERRKAGAWNPAGGGPAGGSPAGWGPARPVSPPRPARRRRGAVIVAAIAGVVVLVSVFVAAALGNGSSSPGQDSSPPPQAGAATTAPSTTPGAAAAAPGIPADFEGTWGGSISVPGLGPDEVMMTLGRGSPGAEIGTFANQTLECDAAVYLEGGSGPVYLRLISTSNTLGECVSYAYAQVSRTSGSSLQFTFEQSSAIDPAEPASNVANGSGPLSPVN